MNTSWMGMRLLTLSLIGAVLVSSIGLGVLFNFLFEHLTETSNNTQYSQEKAIFATLADALDHQFDVQPLLDHWSNTEQSLSVIHISDFPLPLVLQQQLAQGEILMLESEDGVHLHKLLTDKASVLSLHIRIERQQEQYALKRWLTFSFYIALLLSILVWLFPLLMRLLKLRQAAQHFGAGKLNARVPVGRISYIADIEFEFNRMAQRIQTLIGDIKLLTNTVSHDLRTPLARIRFGVETMAEEEDGEQREYYQQRIIRDVDDMVEMVEHLLDFARLEQNMLSAGQERINLSELLTSLVRKLQKQEKTLTLALPAAPISLIANRLFLSMLLNNLVSNAIKFAASHILISAQQVTGKVILSVEDDGVGVPDDRREDVFKPFIRIDNDAIHKGFGLGLAAVKRIAEFYAGDVYVSRSDYLGGAKFEVHLSTKLS